MDYKNLILRIIFSSLLISLYIVFHNNINLLLLFGLLIYFIIFYEILISFKKFKYLIIFYLALSFFCFFIFLSLYFEFYIFNLLILIIIVFDSSSYFFGKYYGKNFPFKIISPKKSYEGYFGGILTTNFLYFLLYYKFSNYIDLYYNFYLVNSLILFSLFGDLIESYFKRVNNLKDSSKLLPGHGGFFDRFDSFISSIIFLTAYSYFYL
tara:strand:+ start:1790 stop:2416 length:627 start_codon:yes stop_codon:yes gene_type:complete